MIRGAGDCRRERVTKARERTLHASPLGLRDSREKIRRVVANRLLERAARFLAGGRQLEKAAAPVLRVLATDREPAPWQDGDPDGLLCRPAGLAFSQ